MPEESKQEEMKKCWWCGSFYRGRLMDHVCNDGCTHVQRLSKPYRVYDAEVLDLTPADRNLLIGMKIKP